MNASSLYAGTMMIDEDIVCTASPVELVFELRCFRVKILAKWIDSIRAFSAESTTQTRVELTLREPPDVEELLAPSKDMARTIVEEVAELSGARTESKRLANPHKDVARTMRETLRATKFQIVFNLDRKGVRAGLAPLRLQRKSPNTPPKSVGQDVASPTSPQKRQRTECGANASSGGLILERWAFEELKSNAQILEVQLDAEGALVLEPVGGFNQLLGACRADAPMPQLWACFAGFPRCNQEEVLRTLPISVKNRMRMYLSERLASA